MIKVNKFTCVAQKYAKKYHDFYKFEKRGAICKAIYGRKNCARLISKAKIL